MATYRIWGSYQGNKRELIDTANTARSAIYLRGEYEMAFGKDWNIWVIPNPYKEKEINKSLNNNFNFHRFDIIGCETFRSKS